MMLMINITATLRMYTLKRYQLWIPIVIILTVTLSASILKTKQPIPTSFDKQFSGTGLVETIENTGTRCTVNVALYDWLNLGKDYPLLEIPSRNDRFSIIAQGDTCNAITVAAASTNGHIAFSAGNKKNKWYFTEQPIAGSGCGGLALDWKPEPQKLN